MVAPTWFDHSLVTATGGSAARTLADRFADISTPKSFGAVGDGVTDDTAEVAAAVASGKPLYWPAGDYLTTASIAGFHGVRHAGPGTVKRGTDTFRFEQESTQRNTLYVATTGLDTNDGLSSSQPFLTIQAAIDAWARYARGARGPWTIKLAAGTYNRGGVADGIRSPTELTIEGALSGSTPTVILDGTSALSTHGLNFNDGVRARAKWIDARNYQLVSGSCGITFQNGCVGIIEGCHASNNRFASFNAGEFTDLTIIGNCQISIGSGYGIRYYRNCTGSIGDSTNPVSLLGTSAVGSIGMQIRDNSYIVCNHGITLNALENGLYVWKHSYAELRNATISNNSYGITVDSLSLLATSGGVQTYTSNSVNSRFRGFSYDQADSSEAVWNDATKRFGFGGVGTPGAKYHLIGAAGVTAQGVSSNYDVAIENNGQTGLQFLSNGNNARIDFDKISSIAHVASDSTLRLTANAVEYRLSTVGSYPATDNARLLGQSFARWSAAYAVQFRPGAGATIWTAGTGTPEGSVTAPVGSIYARTDGTAGAVLYAKESGSGNTGWVAASGTVTAAGSTAARTLAAHLGDVVSVKNFGAVGDGVTSDQTAVAAAVVAAAAVGADVEWPAGTYLITANVPSFHSVRHRGAGTVKRGSFLFKPVPTVTTENTLYVNSATGSDSNHGLHTSEPFLTPQAALDALLNYGPALTGKWTVRLAAGTYPGCTVPRGLNVAGKAGTADNYIYISGPGVTHPTVPTAIIDYAADNTKTSGIVAQHFQNLFISDVKTTGFPSSGVFISMHSLCYFDNHHDAGSAVGRRIYNNSAYYSDGGILSGNTTYGIDELFGVTRDFTQAGSTAAGTIIQSCPIGLHAKENTRGHIDYLTLQDCTISGLQMQAWSTANVGNATFKRNAIDIVVVNSEVHEVNNVLWGTGADISTRRILSLGNSSQIDMFGWASPTTGPLLRTGHRPPVLLYSSYADTAVSATTSETTVLSAATIVPAGYLDVQGRRVRAMVWGRVGSGGALTGPVRVLIRLGGVLGTEVQLPTGTAADSYFRAEFEILCTADGNFQRYTGTMTGADIVTDTILQDRTQDVSAAKTVAISVINANVTDSVTIKSGEVWG